MIHVVKFIVDQKYIKGLIREFASSEIDTINDLELKSIPNRVFVSQSPKCECTIHGKNSKKRYLVNTGEEGLTTYLIKDVSSVRIVNDDMVELMAIRGSLIYFDVIITWIDNQKKIVPPDLLKYFTDRNNDIRCIWDKYIK